MALVLWLGIRYACVNFRVVTRRDHQRNVGNVETSGSSRKSILSIRRQPHGDQGVSSENLQPRAHSKHQHNNRFFGFLALNSIHVRGITVFGTVLLPPPLPPVLRMSKYLHSRIEHDKWEIVTTLAMLTVHTCAKFHFAFCISHEGKSQRCEDIRISDGKTLCFVRRRGPLNMT